MTQTMLDYNGAATYLKLNKNTLYAMVAKRQIPHIRLGPRLVRFRLDDLDEWVRDHEVAPIGGKQNS